MLQFYNALLLYGGHFGLETKIKMFYPHSDFACYKQAHTHTHW